MKPSRWVRIFGMMMLFALPTAFLIDMLRWQHWRYAGPVLWGAIVTGAFAGEVWHRWRTGLYEVETVRTFSERKVKKPMVYREGSRWKWEYSVAYLGCTEHHTSRKTFPSKAAAKEDLRVDMCFEWLDDS